VNSFALVCNHFKLQNFRVVVIIKTGTETGNDTLKTGIETELKLATQNRRERDYRF